MSEIWDLLLSSLLSTCFISCVWIIFFSVRRLHGFRQAGRSTSLYLPEMNCEKHAKPSLEKAAKESECGPLRSPFNCPIAADKPQKQETKQNQKHKPQILVSGSLSWAHLAVLVYQKNQCRIFVGHIASSKLTTIHTWKKGTFFISWDEHDSSYVTLHPVLQRNQHHRNPQMMSFISAYACPYATWYCKKSLRGLTPLRVLLTHEIVITTALLNMNRRVFRLALSVLSKAMVLLVSWTSGTLQLIDLNTSMENPKHPKKMKIIFSIGNLTQLFPYLQINVCPANIYIYIN